MSLSINNKMMMESQHYRYASLPEIREQFVQNNTIDKIINERVKLKLRSQSSLNHNFDSKSSKYGKYPGDVYQLKSNMKVADSKGNKMKYSNLRIKNRSKIEILQTNEKTNNFMLTLPVLAEENGTELS